jgi:hypothetical protein
MGQLVGLLVFTPFAFLCPIYLLKLRKPEQIFLSAAIITAPWFGGLWLGFIKIDLRLTYFFVLIAFGFIIRKSLNFRKIKNISNTIILPSILLIVWTIISSMDAYDSQLALGGSVVLIFNLLFLITILLSVKKVMDIDYILKSLFIALFFCSILALLQYKIRFFHVGFIDRSFTTFMFWRTRSTFHHANQYGMYQILILPILFRQIIITYQAHNQRMFYSYLGLFLLSLFTLYTTSNRGSWVGFAFGMFVVITMEMFQSGGKAKRIISRLIFYLLILSVIPSIRYGPRIYNRMFEGKDGVAHKIESRSEYDDDAIKQIKNHPLLGVGIWNLQFYSDIIFTHNLYLIVPAEAGIPGFLFFLWILLGMLKHARKLKKSKQFVASQIGNGFLAALLGLLLASFPGPDLWVSYQVSIHLWIIAGIAISTHWVYQRELVAKKMQQFLQLKHNVKTKKSFDSIP